MKVSLACYNPELETTLTYPFKFVDPSSVLYMVVRLLLCCTL